MPSYQDYDVEIRTGLSNLPEWELEVVSRNSNKITFLIARSSTMDMRLQSYVARGEPFWLSGLICHCFGFVILGCCSFSTSNICIFREEKQKYGSQLGCRCPNKFIQNVQSRFGTMV